MWRRSIRPTGAWWDTATSRTRTSSASCSEPAELAHSLAVRVERLRVCSPHPVDALLELVSERDPGVLVFGPDRSQLRRRTVRARSQADPRASSVPRLDSGGLSWYRACRPVRNTVGEEAIDVDPEDSARTSSSGPASTGSPRPITSRRSYALAVQARAPTSSSSTSRSRAQGHPASPAASSATTTSSRR